MIPTNPNRCRECYKLLDHCVCDFGDDEQWAVQEMDTPDDEDVTLSEADATRLTNEEVEPL